MSHRIHVRPGLLPVVDAATKVLILGSFPGEASLAAQQYYAHPRNHFWLLLGAILDVPLFPRTYRERLDALRRHRIGLWDVIVRCARVGSLDSSIRQPLHGEARVVQRKAPDIEWVCFNGKTAGRAESVWRAAGYRTCVLPSSSPAYTLPFADKLAAWRNAVEEGLGAHRPVSGTVVDTATSRRNRSKEVA